MPKRKQKDQAVYVCIECDRTYFRVDRDEWESNRHKFNSLASKAKLRHRCPKGQEESK